MGQFYTVKRILLAKEKVLPTVGILYDLLTRSRCKLQIIPETKLVIQIKDAEKNCKVSITDTFKSEMFFWLDFLRDVNAVVDLTRNLVITDSYIALVEKNEKNPDAFTSLIWRLRRMKKSAGNTILVVISSNTY